MKHVRFALCTVLIVSIMLAACQKEHSSSGQNSPGITTDKSQVKTGETVTLTVQNAVPGAAIKWTIKPETTSTLTREYTFTDQNTVSFSSPGTYSVNAESRKVMCDSAAAAHPGMDTCFNSGTQVSLQTATIVVSN